MPTPNPTPHRATPDGQLPGPDVWDAIYSMADRLVDAERRISELGAKELQILQRSNQDWQQEQDARIAAVEQRLSAIEGNATQPAPSAPAGSLVQAVADAIFEAPNTSEGWRSEARAAILAVAEWLASNSPKGFYVRAARCLREEVEHNG